MARYDALLKLPVTREMRADLIAAAARDDLKWQPFLRDLLRRELDRRRDFDSGPRAGAGARARGRGRE